MKGTAEFFGVLADEARLKMLWLLSNHRELCVCDFMEVLEITQSKASRHLRILYRAGLVTDRRDGLWVYYALRPLEAGLAKTQLRELYAHLAERPAAVQLLAKLSTWRSKRGSQPPSLSRPACEPESADACCPSE